MTNELESMRELTENQQSESEQRERVLQRQITEILTQSKTIESEKLSLKNKVTKYFKFYTIYIYIINYRIIIIFNIIFVNEFVT